MFRCCRYVKSIKYNDNSIVRATLCCPSMKRNANISSSSACRPNYPAKRTGGGSRLCSKTLDKTRHLPVTTYGSFIKLKTTAGLDSLATSRTRCSNNPRRPESERIAHLKSVLSIFHRICFVLPPPVTPTRPYKHAAEGYWIHYRWGGSGMIWHI